MNHISNFKTYRILFIKKKTKSFNFPFNYINIFSGLIASAFSLAAVKTAFVFQYNILIGHVSMLIIAIISIRMMPEGISQWLEQRKS